VRDAEEPSATSRGARCLTAASYFSPTTPSIPPSQQPGQSEPGLSECSALLPSTLLHACADLDCLRLDCPRLPLLLPLRVCSVFFSAMQGRDDGRPRCWGGRVGTLLYSLLQSNIPTIILLKLEICAIETLIYSIVQGTRGTYNNNDNFRGREMIVNN
jgi:hypothetical protein